MDRVFLYDMIYALAASEGRGEALFGSSAACAHEAFSRSLVGEGYFPELWFELPLLGEPWFDLHALASAGDVDACGSFGDGAVAWFAAQERDVRQLALSWDCGAGAVSEPAVQLLVERDNADVTCGFLEAAGRGDAVGAYHAFVPRLPEGWFACYTGVFPQRARPHLRVECVVEQRLQEAYAEDLGLLEAHLRQVGFDAFDGTLLPRCAAMARTPFALEFQFDVEPDGTAGSTLGVSLRFAQPPGDGVWCAFDAAEPLMEMVEAWGLADGRWRLLSGTAFAKRLTLGESSVLLWCFPAFLKLRWCDGAPLDAKAYLMAGVEQGTG